MGTVQGSSATLSSRILSRFPSLSYRRLSYRFFKNAHLGNNISIKVKESWKGVEQTHIIMLDSSFNCPPSYGSGSDYLIFAQKTSSGLIVSEPCDMFVRDLSFLYDLSDEYEYLNSLPSMPLRSPYQTFILKGYPYVLLLVGMIAFGLFRLNKKKLLVVFILLMIIVTFQFRQVAQFYSLQRKAQSEIEHLVKKDLNAVYQEISVKNGEYWAREFGCVACHNLDGHSGSVGPSLLNFYGSIVHLEDGPTIVADEKYIFNSIVDPNSEIVSGYSPWVMPDGGAQIWARESDYRYHMWPAPDIYPELVAFIRSLK
ncbi:MAG: hypothetical protein AAF490_02930 [Chloroflexota bacterium]